MLSKRADILGILAFGFVLGLYFLLLWGGAMEALLTVQPSFVAHSYSLGIHVGLMVGYGCISLVGSFEIRSRFAFMGTCLVSGGCGFALPALCARYVEGVGAASVSAFGAILVGVSVSLMVGRCLRFLSGDTADRTLRVRMFLLSAAVGLLLYALLYYVTPKDALLFVICFGLFPAASMLSACVRPARHSGGEGNDADGLGSSRWTVVSLASVSLLGFESMLVSQMGTVIQIHQVGIGLSAGVVLVFAWVILKKFPSIVSTYLVLFPALATLLLAMPFAGGAFQGAAIFASNVASLVVLAVVSTSDATILLRGSSLRPPRSNALFLAAFHGSVLVGFFCGEGIRGFAGDELWVLCATFACLYVISALAFFILLKTVKAERAARREESAIVVDSIDLRCNAVVEKYGLSEREAEVLELIARGRDVPTMARMLSISQNTVRFHTKNLYQTLDVHTKQELIDLVESMG